MYKPISHILHSFLLLVLIGTTGSIVYYLKTIPPEVPIETIPPIPDPSPSVTSVPDTGWSALRPGLERRVIPIHNDQNQQVESVYIWRLDQRHFWLDVAFDERPKSLEAWQKETNAALVLNGGYFSIEDKRYSPDGLTVVKGRASGRSFEGYGGMLAIKGGRAELRWLVEKPYDPSEPLQAALQSFPVLVQPGGKLGFGPERENQARARRTVIAQDKEGRILLIVTPDGYFTLHQISAYLTGSDLNLDIAFNLDGGGSTGILVAKPREIIPSKVLLPFVILVYPR
ncbi:MAG TPA: phosphodiester glycosidase family protein [Anaerolineales bacterium]|nr:phosphodiester glycosidase family protein [Anaerolineales bacterium]